MGAFVHFASTDSRSVSYDYLLPLEWELKMSVNGASIIFVYCIYFAVEHIPCTRGVPHLSTVFRAYTASWPYGSHCNGELKAGVTSALHILCRAYVGRTLFPGWRWNRGLLTFSGERLALHAPWLFAAPAVRFATKPSWRAVDALLEIPRQLQAILEISPISTTSERRSVLRRCWPNIVVRWAMQPFYAAL
jgi:hypothetical protein